jgi:hypothetical protein
MAVLGCQFQAIHLPVEGGIGAGSFFQETEHGLQVSWIQKGGDVIGWETCSMAIIASHSLLSSIGLREEGERSWSQQPSELRFPLMCSVGLRLLLFLGFPSVAAPLG